MSHSSTARAAHCGPGHFATSYDYLKKASRGSEPRSLDSESRVLTVTPQGLLHGARHILSMALQSAKTQPSFVFGPRSYFVIISQVEVLRVCCFGSTLRSSAAFIFFSCTAVFFRARQNTWDTACSIKILKINIHLEGKACRDPGSNRGPSDLQSDAIPTELSRRLACVPPLPD